MNAITRSTVANLGERPRRKSPQNFRSPIARSPNSRRRQLRAPKETPQSAARTASSGSPYQCTRYPVGKLRKSVGNRTFPTCLRSNEIRKWGSGAAPPAWPRAGLGTPARRSASLGRDRFSRVGGPLSRKPAREGATSRAEELRGDSYVRRPRVGVSCCVGDI